MTVGIDDAIDIADQFLGERFSISAAYDGGDRWFFSYGVMDLFNQGENIISPVPGGVSVIAVSKETGEVQRPDFSPLPSWMTGEPPTDDDVALENASEIDLI